MNGSRRPDGIAHGHIHEASGTWLHAWPSDLLLFTAVLLAAAFGLFGKHSTVTGSADGVRLTVAGPSRIRSGEFFEMLFTVETQREIADAVLSVDQDLWHEVTINTMMPQPSEESFGNGAFEFHFGPLTAGSRLLVKVDGQINPAYPPGINEGAFTLLDGEVTFAGVDYSMTVLP